MDVSVHAHSSVATMVMVQAVEDWLPATCWCEHSYVWVPQVDIRDGYTASCGRRGCASPSGLVVLAERCRITTTSAGPTSDGRRTSQLRKPPHLTRRPYRRSDPFSVALRRDNVLQMYKDNMRPHDIALALNVLDHTVNNDLHWMRHRRHLWLPAHVS